MEINENAVLRTLKEIEIDAPVEKVWNIQTNIDAWHEWQPEISHAKLASSLEAGATFFWKSGGFSLSSTIGEVTENKLIGWNGRGFGVSAIHVWEFKQIENGNTLVRTKESMDGWLVRLLKGMLDKKLNESLDIWLLSLKQAAEPR
jgi:hypothetical protein